MVLTHEKLGQPESWNIDAKALHQQVQECYEDRGRVLTKSPSQELDNHFPNRSQHLFCVFVCLYVLSKLPSTARMCVFCARFRFVKQVLCWIVVFGDTKFAQLQDTEYKLPANKLDQTSPDGPHSPFLHDAIVTLT